MSKFYEANDAITAAVVEMYNAEEAAKTAGLKLSRKHGGSRVQVYTARGPIGDLKIIGFRFNTPPDAKHFFQIKGTKDGWRPRKTTGRGRKIANQLDALRVNRMLTVMKLANMPVMDGTLSVTLPGIRQIDGVVYIELPDDVTPPSDCVRVADVDMEAILETAQLEER